MKNYFTANPQSKISKVKWIDLQENAAKAFVKEAKYLYPTPTKEITSKGQWKFKNEKNSQWESFSESDNLLIEAAFLNKEPSISLQNDSIILFEKNIQIIGNRKRLISRTPIKSETPSESKNSPKELFISIKGQEKGNFICSLMNLF